MIGRAAVDGNQIFAASSAFLAAAIATPVGSTDALFDLAQRIHEKIQPGEQHRHRPSTAASGSSHAAAEDAPVPEEAAMANSLVVEDDDEEEDETME